MYGPETYETRVCDHGKRGDEYCHGCIMNDVERIVLADLIDHTHPIERLIPFRPIQRRTGLSRDFVRAACRSLVDRGYAEFASGLWDDEGRPAGSGYAATKAGRDALGERP